MQFGNPSAGTDAEPKDAYGIGGGASEIHFSTSVLCKGFCSTAKKCSRGGQVLAPSIMAMPRSTSHGVVGSHHKVIGTPANKDAVKRMKALVVSMWSIADKLPMFCGPVFLWLLGQNIDNPWMQVLKTGSLIMCFISFILLAFTSKFKETESIDGALFKTSIWLMLPVFFALWPGLCMILHLFAHTSKFILWPLGALFSIISVCFWYWSFYKEMQKILEELKGLCVPEDAVLPEELESEAASDQGLHPDNSYMTVQISSPSIIPAYALSECDLEVHPSLPSDLRELGR